MAVQIGFSTPNYFNPVSWLVRKVTGSKASHAWFLYYDHDFDMPMVMEAHELGFRLIPFEHFKKHNVVVGLYTPEFSLEVGLRYIAKNYLGTMYDFGGLIGMAIVKLGRWLRLKWKNPFAGAHFTFCSEAVVRAMLMSEGYKAFSEDPDSEDPESLRLYFEAEAKRSVTQPLQAQGPGSS